MQPGDGDPRHGTIGGYTNHACRCKPCSEAHRDAHYAYMQAHPEQQAKHRVRARIRYHRAKLNSGRNAATKEET